MITKLTYRSDASGLDYDFVVGYVLDSPEGGSFVAICNHPEGGLTTSARTISGLVLMIPDCVETWEEK